MDTRGATHHSDTQGATTHHTRTQGDNLFLSGLPERLTLRQCCGSAGCLLAPCWCRGVWTACWTSTVRGTSQGFSWTGTVESEEMACSVLTDLSHTQFSLVIAMSHSVWSTHSLNRLHHHRGEQGTDHQSPEFIFIHSFNIHNFKDKNSFVSIILVIVKLSLKVKTNCEVVKPVNRQQHLSVTSYCLNNIATVSSKPKCLICFKSPFNREAVI